MESWPDAAIGPPARTRPRKAASYEVAERSAYLSTSTHDSGPPGPDDLCMNTPVPSKRPFPRVSLIALALALATLADYLVWFGWDQRKDIASDGSVSGPYQSWQVIGLILTAVLITAVAGWRGHPWATALSRLRR
jgi:hypothetical protein